MTIERIGEYTVQVQVTSKKEKASLFPWGYNQELGFGMD